MLHHLFVQCRICQHVKKTRQTIGKRVKLLNAKLEYAAKCRAPNWHRAEVGRAQLVRVKLARAKQDAPNWTLIK